MKNLVESIITLTWLILLLTFITGLAAFKYTMDTKKQFAEELETLEKNVVTNIPMEQSLNLRLGKKIFKENCATCHNKNMRSNSTGPALRGVEQRWGEYPTSDLFKWIRNSTLMIEENHPKALSIWKEWKKKPMNSFPNLTDEEIEAILVYIKNV